MHLLLLRLVVHDKVLLNHHVLLLLLHHLLLGLRMLRHEYLLLRGALHLMRTLVRALMRAALLLPTLHHALRSASGWDRRSGGV